MASYNRVINAHFFNYKIQTYYSSCIKLLQETSSFTVSKTTVVAQIITKLCKVAQFSSMCIFWLSLSSLKTSHTAAPKHV